MAFLVDFLRINNKSISPVEIFIDEPFIGLLLPTVFIILQFVNLIISLILFVIGPILLCPHKQLDNRVRPIYFLLYVYFNFVCGRTIKLISANECDSHKMIIAVNDKNVKKFE